MPAYRIESVEYDTTNPKLEAALEHCYTTKHRPTCLCTPNGVEMYIARMQGKYVIKRMPNTGRLHTPDCDSYEPPHELSGLGEVMGTAIQEMPDDGTINLKIDFSLSKHGNRNAPPPSAGAEHGSVKASVSKLTLRALLHYLWEEAGFNRWSPAMAGKRRWYVIRKYLMQAAQGKNLKGVTLAEIMYVPEVFSIEDESQITERRISRMNKITSGTMGARKLMLVIGEVKDIAAARMGYKVILKHLPNYPFVASEELYNRLTKRFESELSLSESEEGEHLILIGTFSMSGSGVAVLEEVALMVSTAEWIPFEDAYEKMLINKAIAEERRFTKGLRYNLTSKRPLASIVLSDEETPTAMYIIPPGASDTYKSEVKQLIDESTLAAWEWHVAETATMPSLPPRSGAQREVNLARSK